MRYKALPDHGFGLWARDHDAITINRRYHDHVEQAVAAERERTRAALQDAIDCHGSEGDPDDEYDVGYMEGLRYAMSITAERGGEWRWT